MALRGRDVLTYAVVGACAAAGIALAIVFVFGWHQVSHVSGIPAQPEESSVGGMLVGGGLAAVVVLGTLAYCVFYLPRRFARDDRAQRETPRQAIRDLVAGTRVRVVGSARSVGEELIGPHSGTVCLAYVARAMDQQLQPRKSSRAVAFRIADETGAIDIAVDHVKLDLVSDVHSAPASFGAGIIRREAANLGEDERGSSLWEDVLRPEQLVAATGLVERGDGGALRLAGTQDRPLVISTWSAAREP